MKNDRSLVKNALMQKNSETKSLEKTKEKTPTPAITKQTVPTDN
jgi:hypothetical protein